MNNRYMPPDPQDMERPESGLPPVRHAENGISAHDGGNMTAQPVLNAPSIGQQNQGVIDSTSRAKRAAVRLARAGCTIKHIAVGNRNTRVLVENHPLLPIFLEASPIKYTGTETTMAASIEGVQVEWVIRRVP
ncbi:hypothetical protein [Nitrosovibrio sp. Nv4]|uniref:hypothetical protein n=1 Tax=Nitrosovibrio sp. Nv4 TaxID=1945880 RepID=UPI000BCFD888|nr:hypothetical protein [Nitrosovibrio sp. Nv4]SOD42300.1 hypothetical protein SAMN06298226_2638 [Nitrosovibrio sp. Nv4]